MMLRKIRNIDYVILIVSAAILSVLYTFFNSYFFLIMFVTMALLAFATLLVRRIIVPFLMPVAGSLLTRLIIEFTDKTFNTKILLVLILAGAIFEILIILARKLLEDNSWLIMLISALSSSIVPVLFTLLLKESIKDNVLEIVNSVLCYFLIGLAAGAISYIVWYFIRHNSTILKIMHKEYIF